MPRKQFVAVLQTNKMFSYQRQCSYGNGSCCSKYVCKCGADNRNALGCHCTELEGWTINLRVNVINFCQRSLALMCSVAAPLPNLLCIFLVDWRQKELDGDNLQMSFYLEALLIRFLSTLNSKQGFHFQKSLHLPYCFSPFHPSCNLNSRAVILIWFSIFLPFSISPLFTP